MIRIVRVDVLDQPTFEIHHRGKLVKSAGDAETAKLHLASMRQLSGISEPWFRIRSSAWAWSARARWSRRRSKGLP